MILSHSRSCIFHIWELFKSQELTKTLIPALQILYLASRWEKNSLARVLIHIQAQRDHPRSFSHFPKNTSQLLRNAKQLLNNVTPGMSYQICGLADLIKALLNGQHYSFIKPTENTENLKSTEQHFPHLFILNHFYCCFPRRSHTTMTSEFSVKLTF